MGQEMDRLWDAMGVNLTPSHSTRSAKFPIKIDTTPTQIEITLFAAGLDIDALDLCVDQNRLTVAGKRPINRDEEAIRYLKKERFEGEFHYVINLPEEIDSDNIKANYHNGILRITVAKRAPEKPIRIKVQ
jgi:HSP20 family protein